MVLIKHLIVLAPFVLGALASNDHNSNSDNHSDDHSSSDQTLNQGGYFGGCGLAVNARGAPVQRRALLTFDHTNSNGNVQGNICGRSELQEAEAEKRDIHEGFNALDILTRRGNDHNSNSDDHSDDHSSSSSTANGGGYFGGCRRADFSSAVGQAMASGQPLMSFDNTNGSGNVQGNLCARSAQLAIRDIGGMYRRFQARSFDETSADEAAEVLRRHAEHLGLL